LISFQIVHRLGRRNSIQLVVILLAVASFSIGAARSPSQAPAPQQQQPAPGSPQQPSPALTPSPPVAPPQRPAFVVILDPGHGGADNGARGASGVVEKDVALALAKATRAQLQQQGLRVLLTRESDEDPSFDERATLANAQRSALLVSFHVSSTGKVGSVRTYYYTFAPVTAAAANPAGSPAAAPRAASHLIPWDRAQENFAEGSHRLADLIQAELVKNFPGSPGQSSAVPLRDLRSVAAPAVSVELSSVTVADRGALEAMYTPLAASIARGIVAFHSTSASNAGGH
jgi:N-acetylmuramoyl-L-alanine amidase